MAVSLEDRIREAVLAVRWKRAGDGPDPAYFVGATSESFQLEGSAASFLARFITERVAADDREQRESSTEGDLDKYGLEVIAGYLEDQGYTVWSPD